MARMTRPWKSHKRLPKVRHRRKSIQRLLPKVKVWLLTFRLQMPMVETHQRSLNRPDVLTGDKKHTAENATQLNVLCRDALNVKLNVRNASRQNEMYGPGSFRAQRSPNPALSSSADVSKASPCPVHMRPCEHAASSCTQDELSTPSRICHES